MTKVLITGAAGSGKTTLAHELKAMGHTAVDVDAETQIAGSKNLTTGAIEQVPSPRPEGWRLNHQWIWDGQRLHSFLEEYKDKDIYVFGYADNIYDYFPEFDEVVFLKVSTDMIIKRLLDRGPGAFGHQEIERHHALEAQAKLEEQAGVIGALVINTGQPIDMVTSQIIRDDHGK